MTAYEFRPAHWVEQAWACLDCGAVVEDTVLHREFHRRLDLAAQMAADAEATAGMLRPIGPSPGERPFGMEDEPAPGRWWQQ